MNREERLGEGPTPRWGQDKAPGYQDQSGYGTGGYGDQRTPYGYGRTSAYHNSLLSSRQGRQGRSPSSYERSDERIRGEIWDRLRGQKDIDVSDTDCNVTEGTVVLSGTVSGRREGHLVEELAASIWGVTGVRSNLRVRSAAGTTRNPG